MTPRQHRQIREQLLAMLAHLQAKRECLDRLLAIYTAVLEHIEHEGD